MKTTSTVLAVAAGLALLALLYAYSGLYDIGADVPHRPITRELIDVVRDRSIASRAADVQPVDLNNSAMILKGAGHYAAMCVDCHRAPGHAESELRRGLYPAPPDLTRTPVEARVAFWTIKHGIKMSAMPAWGPTHDDETIWCLVAFLKRLPSLDAAHYASIIAQAPPDDDEDHDH